MGDWAKVIFYYDYERENARKEKAERITGLISKSYKYEGVPNLFMHAYSGLRFFQKNAMLPYVNYDAVSTLGDSDCGDWGRLNTAFDIFFECYDFSFGRDSVIDVLNEITHDMLDADERQMQLQNADTKQEQLQDEDTLQEQLQDADEEAEDRDAAYDYHLYACEGTNGFFYISFTGNPQDGYQLKYGYDYGGVDSDGEKLHSIEESIAYYNRRWQRDDDEPLTPFERAIYPMEEQQLVSFFNENASILTIEEKDALCEEGLRCVKHAASSLAEIIRVENALEERRLTYEKGSLPEDYLQDSVDYLGFARRTNLALSRNEIQTIAELLDYLETDRELLNLKGIRTREREMIFEKLKAFGLWE